MQKRCPWCGKVVKTRGWNRFKENYQKRTPISFLFTKCPACNHFLGQNYKSLRVAFTGLAMLASVILAYVHISLVFIALALVQYEIKPKTSGLQYELVPVTVPEYDYQFDASKLQAVIGGVLVIGAVGGLIYVTVQSGGSAAPVTVPLIYKLLYA